MVVSFLTEFWSLDHSSFTENPNSTANQETPFLLAFHITFSLILFSSVIQSCPTLQPPWTAARQASLSIANSQSLFKLIFIESVIPSNPFILCHPLLLPPSPQSFLASGSFQMSQFFASGQSIGVSASTSVLPKNIQD